MQCRDRIQESRLTKPATTQHLNFQNSAEHSGVRRFEVELFGTSEAIYLKVHDSGVGFDPTATTNGLGLISAQERVKMVKGNVSIDSGPNMGTTVHARVPLPD